MAGKTVKLTIDGKEVTVPAGTTIWEAAKELGTDIPVLCHNPRLRPVGVCRMCVVDVGERVLAASCVRECAEGMKVTTGSEKIQRQRKMLTQLLLSEYPEHSLRQEATGQDELLNLAREQGIDRVPVPDGSAGSPRGSDASSPVIGVDHQACILCDRCIRACDELQHNDVIGRTGKGYHARIAFDLNNPMGDSTCVSCGECMAACPTGALTNKTWLRMVPAK
ncbi:MAG TPA: 2Fe-2S iron-sulfur cluster-binding protein [bacterium]